MILFDHLLRKFQPREDYEYEGARHQTHTPSRGSHAYLNIIFLPADAEVQAGKIDPIGLPEQVRDFYLTYNGAHLLAGAFCIYGFFPFVYLYDRKDFRRSYPYNIEDVHQGFEIDLRTSGIVQVGSYKWDRSEVFVDKSTGIVRCSVGDDPSELRAVWPSFDAWIEEEIERLSEYFDQFGNQLVDYETMLPGRR